MTVIPFPSTRFTKYDVTAVVDLCYRLTCQDLAGGWARHSSDDGTDILSILNPRDNDPLLTFGRECDGHYYVLDGRGRMITGGATIDEVLDSVGGPLWPPAEPRRSNVLG